MRWLTLVVHITEVRVATATSIRVCRKRFLFCADTRRQRVAAAGCARHSPRVRSKRGFSIIGAVYEKTMQRRRKKRRPFEREQIVSFVLCAHGRSSWKV